jgi:hypothetical protein
MLLFYKVLKYIYSKIKNSVLNFTVWTYFIFSVLGFYIFSKKKIMLINVENWHLVITHFKNIRKFSNFNKKDYSVIYINLYSEAMCFFLNFFLDTRKKNFLLSKKFYKIFRITMWTIFLRDNNSGDDLKNIDILDEKKYLKFFKFKSNNFLKKKKFNSLSNVFNNEKISAVLLTQISYSEIFIYSFATLNKKKIFFWGDKILCLDYPYNSISKKIYNCHLINKRKIPILIKKKAQTVLNNRFNGIYKNYINYKFYLTGKLNSDINYSFFDNQKKPTLFLYLHCFSDAPYSFINFYENDIFIDHFHSSLFVINFAIRNNLKLFIKVHPQSNVFKNDIFFINNIKKIIQDNKNMTMIDNIPLHKIKNSYKPIIITSFGTITLEAAYSGIPVITLGNSYLNYTNMCLNLKKKKNFKFLINNSYKFYKFKVARKEAIYFQASQMYDQYNFSKIYKS